MNFLLIDDQSSMFIRHLQTLTASRPSLQSVVWHTANDGETGLLMLEKEHFHLVLMDGSLAPMLRPRYPYGDGVVRAIRATGNTVPICMFSSDQRFNQNGLTAGANSVANKEKLLSTSEDANVRKQEKEEFAQILTACAGIENT